MPKLFLKPGMPLVMYPSFRHSGVVEMREKIESICADGCLEVRIGIVVITGVEDLGVGAHRVVGNGWCCCGGGGGSSC